MPDEEVDPNDVEAISAEHTDQTDEAPNPAGPANPTDIGAPGTDGVAEEDPTSDQQAA